MHLDPAIDLRQGRVVRLAQGEAYFAHAEYQAAALAAYEAAAAGARYGMDGAEREATLRAWQAVGVL